MNPWLQNGIAALALNLFLGVAGSHALEIGSTSEEISRKHGPPAQWDLERQMATYRWSGWRLEIQFKGNIASTLVYTHDKAITSTEIDGILAANGGGGRMAKVR